MNTFKVRLNSSVTSPNLVYSLLPLMNLVCLFPGLSNKYVFRYYGIYLYFPPNLIIIFSIFHVASKPFFNHDQLLGFILVSKGNFIGLLSYLNTFYHYHPGTGRLDSPPVVNCTIDFTTQEVSLFYLKDKISIACPHGIKSKQY